MIPELTEVAVNILGGEVGNPPGSVAIMGLGVEYISYQSPGVSRTATRNCKHIEMRRP